MKSMRLQDLKKRSDKYFRNLGIITPGRKKEKTIRYIIDRIFDAVPKKVKQYIEDPEQLKKVLTHTVIVGGKYGKIDPYKAILEFAKHQRKASGDETLDYIWKRFKQENPQTYNHYNTYVYRLGYSAKNWFMENAEITVNGSNSTCSVKLPTKTTGMVYYELYIEYDFSGGILWAYMTV